MKTTLLILIALLISACGPEPTKQLKTISYGSYTESTFDKMPSWQDENFSEALKIFIKTCEHINTKELFKVVCSNAKTTISPRTFFEDNFTPFLALAERPQVSGYYEPLLYGSLKRSRAFPYPVYGIPEDMFEINLLASYQKEFSKPLRGHMLNKTIKPYFSRKQINEGAIKTKPICYVDDKVDLYFLQEEGSGRIQLENKKNIYLGYGDFNGHPYHSIQEEMIKRNIFKENEVTPKKMRQYLRKHAQLQDEIFQTNAAYTFFEKYEQKVMGTLGMPLTQRRSTAVDKRSIPLGMPMFVDMKEPLSEQRLQKIMFAHDTRKNLKGDGKIEVYFGSGKTARNEAEAAHENFNLWILVPNDYLHHDYLLRSKYL